MIPPVKYTGVAGHAGFRKLIRPVMMYSIDTPTIGQSATAWFIHAKNTTVIFATITDMKKYPTPSIIILHSTDVHGLATRGVWLTCI
eukprot:SAG31_NODE_14875_length_782_cov_1.446559_1_plen_87_part_00